MAENQPAQHPLDLSSLRKVLIIKWGALGDLVIMSGLLDGIRAALPQAQIVLNTQPQWRDLFQHDPRIHHVYTQLVRGPQQWQYLRTWLRWLKAQKFDLIIDLQSSDRSRGWLAIATLLRGSACYRLGNHAGWPYQFAPASLPATTHAFTRHAAALASIGIAIDAHAPARLQLSKATRARVASLQEQQHLQPNQYVVFLPGCHPRGYLKRWGTQNYAQLAQLLHQQASIANIVIVGSQEESSLAEEISQLNDHPHWILNLCGQTQLLDIPVLCEGARIIVGNDTGTAHLASCANRPLLVICGPTDPRRVKPLGPKTETIQADLSCVNCYLKECAHHSCMRVLTPAMVFAKMKQMMHR